jgi:hypothetical protein
VRLAVLSLGNGIKQKGEDRARLQRKENMKSQLISTNF